jgi:hypothetical protein
MKIHKVLLVFLLFSGTYLTVSAQDMWFRNLKKLKWLNQISQIELLKSNKIDVEKILGVPEYFDESFLGRDFIKSYLTKKGKVTIKFTRHQCWTKNRRYIPAGVVEKVRFDPENKIKLSELGLPLSELDKTDEDDTPLEIYTNKKNGIEIVAQDGEVTGIIFTSPDDMEFDCENSKKQPLN